MGDTTDYIHDLEDHIPILQKLDEARKRSGKLRDEGIEVLMECICPPEDNEPLPISDEWRYESSLFVRALLTLHDQPFGDADKETKRLKLIESLINQLRKDFTLKILAENEFSVLLAASILQVLVAQPGAAFSKTAMLCYYWIIRELYAADRSDWNIGGARAAPGGLVTAFTTGECVRALLGFTEALRNTGLFIEAVGEYLERTDQLNSLDAYYFSTEPDAKPLEEWVDAEKDRLNLSYFLKLRHLSRYLVLPLAPSDANVQQYLQTFIDNDFKTTLIKLLENAEGEFSAALEDGEDGEEGINSSHKKEISSDITRSASASMIAKKAVEDAKERVLNAKGLITNNGELKINDLCKAIKRGFDEAADEVQKLLIPVENYLSSVLDRELALVSLGESWDWQPCELACAASSYGRLTKGWKKDARFARAVIDLSKMVSSRGRFANPRHIHERHDGSRRMMRNPAILHAMAQLLRYARDGEIEPKLVADLADRMLYFFEDTRASLPRDFWSFGITDINSEPSKWFANIRTKIDKLPQEMQVLLQALGGQEDLPKPTTEAITEQLVMTFNNFLQDESIEEQKQIAIKDVDKDNKKKLAAMEVEQCKKYFSLLKRLYLEASVPGGIRKINVGRAVEQASSKKKGWGREFTQSPLKTDLTTTANAVLALAEINKMLDMRINHIILKHFSVKEKNKELSENLTLDSLFYPDYGLLLAPNPLPTDCPKEIKDKDWPEKIQREKSVALVLLKMRAHVSRVSLPEECDALCSLVLHGPAGTGKTTLVEALAVTCDVPLVEVTPSDLVKRGEADIEQQARTVFEALSMLTRVVILFDEFDPVLKRRDVGNNNPLSVFTFLTPGMLPKLKTLHSQAEKRSVAYVLVTNLIGELDEAAVRQGRFDERLGIYPPDLLSRVGRFLDQFSKQIRDNCKESKNELPDGIEVLGSLGLKDGANGTLSFDKDKKCLTWRYCDVDVVTKDSEASDSVWTLQTKNKDGKEVSLYVSIDMSKLTDGSSQSFELILSKNIPWNRIVQIIHNTASKGMTTLGKPGWFSYSQKKPKASTPIGFVLGMAKKLEMPEADDEFKGIRGEGRTAVTECLQWMWVNAWDDKLSKDAKNDKDLCSALEEPKKEDSEETDSLNNLPPPKFAQSLRDQWEVLETGNICHKRKWFIRHPKQDLDET